MATKAKKTTKKAPRHKKGKQHPLHAHSLERMARDAEAKSEYILAGILRTEANRVRGIV